MKTQVMVATKCVSITDEGGSEKEKEGGKDYRITWYIKSAKRLKMINMWGCTEEAIKTARLLEANKWFDRWRVFEVDKGSRIQIVCDHINNRYAVPPPPDDSSPHDEEEPEPVS